MDKLDNLEQLIKALVGTSEFKEIGDKDIEDALEERLVRKINHKLKEKGWINDEKCL